jgi:hypothetical protein
MSNNLTLADAINQALYTGQEATFVYEGTLYTFSPAGMIEFLQAEANFVETEDVVASLEVGDLTVSQVLMITDLPTADPEVVGQIWNNANVLTVSEGAP